MEQFRVPKSKTHFEQIPLQAVRKIAAEYSAEDRHAEIDRVRVEHPSRKTEPYSVRIHSLNQEMRWQVNPSFGPEAEESLKYPEWQKPYQQALTELDKAKLRQRVAAAETAIFKRQQVLSRAPKDQLEEQAIENALRFLRVLKQEAGKEATLFEEKNREEGSKW